MPLSELLPADLQTHESLKSFESPETLARAYIDMNGKMSARGIDLLTEDLRKDPTVANYKTIDDMAKGFIETKKLVGTIKKPPEKPDGYKFTQPENLHKNIQVTPEYLTNMSTLAHKRGLTVEQADGINQDYLTMMTTALTRADEARAGKAKENETSLRQKWAGDYDRNYKMVERLIIQAANSEGISKEEAIGSFGSLPQNTVVLRILAKTASLLSEDSIRKLGVSSLETNDTDALAKIAQIEGDPKHAYFNDRDPNHAKAVQEMRELYKVAYPNKGG